MQYTAKLKYVRSFCAHEFFSLKQVLVLFMERTYYVLRREDIFFSFVVVNFFFFLTMWIVCKLRLWLTFIRWIRKNCYLFIFPLYIYIFLFCVSSVARNTCCVIIEPQIWTIIFIDAEQRIIVWLDVYCW